MNEQEFYGSLTATLVQMGFQPVSHEAKIQRVIDEAHQTLTKHFLFKIVKGAAYPNTVIAIVPADDLKHQDFLSLTSKLETVIVNFERQARRPGWWPLSSGCFGVVLYVFFDRNKANEFAASLQDSCKITQVLKKIYGLPWVVDVTAKRASNNRVMGAMFGGLGGLTVDKLNAFMSTV